MKVHLRFDGSAGRHQRITLFANGANVGTLCMTKAEAIWFNHILEKGCKALSPAGRKPVEFVASGEGPAVSDEEVVEAVL